MPDFFDSEYANWETDSNKLLVLNATEKAVLAEKSDIKFEEKIIYAQSYQNQITEASTNKVFSFLTFAKYVGHFSSTE